VCEWLRKKECNLNTKGEGGREGGRARGMTRLLEWGGHHTKTKRKEEEEEEEEEEEKRRRKIKG
jgi:hypothetical protein